jgi:hypothetical protein
MTEAKLHDRVRFHTGPSAEEGEVTEDVSASLVIVTTDSGARWLIDRYSLRVLP